MRPSALILVLLAATACAQRAAQAPVDPDEPAVLETVPAPSLRDYLSGFHGSVSLISVHDSSAGWYTLVNPGLAYSVSRNFSADISMPLYLYRLAETTTTTQFPQQPGQPPQRPQTTTQLQPHTFDPGDMVLAAHASFNTLRLYDTVTPSITLPTGDATYGLSTGRVTFDFDNHLQCNTSRLGWILDIGGGNSSDLFNRLVTQNYTAVGPLVHFQTGFTSPFLFRGSFTSVAYEQLPIGNNKIYSTLAHPGYPAQTVVSGQNAIEDNGFTNSLQFPFTRHLSLQGYYNRSLRLHLDTVAMGITFTTHSQRRETSSPPELLDETLAR